MPTDGPGTTYPAGEEPKLFRMYKEAIGGPDLQALKPELCMGLDDAACYVHCEATAERSAGWHHVGSADHAAMSGSQSFFKDPTEPNGSAFQPGLKMRGTYGHTAGGDVMPIVQTIELPYDQMEEPFAVLPIKGLAVNATNPDLAQLSTGHLLFVREEPNGGTYQNKVRAATWVFTDVVVPFLDSIRTNRFGWVEGQPVPDPLVARFNLDACNEQIDLTRDPAIIKLCAEKRIVMIKGNPGRTGQEIACDLARSHALVKEAIRAWFTRTLTKDRLWAGVKADLDGDPKMKKLTPATMKALERIVPNLPAVYQKSFADHIVTAGHNDAGDVNEATGVSVPDYDNILATHSKAWTQEAIDRVDAALMGGAFMDAFKHGAVQESTLDTHNVPIDTDSTGKEKPRNNDDVTLRSSRTMLVHDPAVLAARAGALKKADDAKVDEWKAECALVDLRLREAATVEEKVSRQAGKALPASQEKRDALMREMCTHEVLEGFKQPRDNSPSKVELLAYAQIRRFRTSEPSVAGWKGTPKSTAKLTASGGAPTPCATTLAADVVGKPILTSHPAKPTPTMPPAPVAPAPPHRVQAPGRSAGRTARECLPNAARRRAVKRTTKGGEFASAQLAPTDALLDRADAVERALRARLTPHIAKMRFDDNKKTERTQRSWVWAWFQENLGELAALVTWAGHAVPFPGHVKHARSVLANLHGGEHQETKDGDRAGAAQGAHLFVAPDGSVVRSGKAWRKGGINARRLEHIKALNTDADTRVTSKFYKTHPTKASGTTPPSGVHFDDLKLVMALGYDDADAEAMKILSSDDAIFRWSTHLSKIKKVNFGGDASAQSTVGQQHFAAYAIELAYDLLIGSDDNLSTSPGFETPLGYNL